MKNRIGLIGAWVLATALAMGVASQAVGLVADRAAEIPVQVPIAVAGPASFDSSTSTLVQPTTTGQPSTTLTTTTAPTTPTTPGSGATTTTLSPVTTLVTTTTSPTTTTTVPPLPLDSGSFVATGGRVTVACTGANTITLLGTSPVGGWSVEVESSGPEKVRVDFESGEEESEIEVVCVNGQLQADISD
ncbi:MAG: hypothetical protein OER12_04600 [Acidimicrobiia bacterium]|nr:hypothetical protein [Acidimicrobiia bacterium]